MRTIVCVVALAALSAGSALATETPDANRHAKEAVALEGKAERTLYICENDTLTRRAFTREFGTVEFVTAEEAAAKGQAWDAPKCITSYEARRLKQLAVAK
ncbi:MAG: hypothetical protein ACOY5Y_12530 [Pseudomonadota bacterium]